MTRKNKAPNKSNKKNKFLKNTVIATSATLVASMPVSVDAEEYSVGYMLEHDTVATTENYKYGSVSTTLETNNSVGDLKTEILKEMNIVSGVSDYSIYIVNISDSLVQLNKQDDSVLLSSISFGSRIVIAKSTIDEASIDSTHDQNIEDKKITASVGKLSAGTKTDSNKLTIIGSFVLGLNQKSDKAGFVTEDKHNQIEVKNSYFGGNSGTSGGVFYLDGTDSSNNINLDINNRFENTIENSVFEKNNAVGTGEFDGGGGAIDSSNIVTIKNSEFKENSSYHNGGAVQLSQRGKSTITGSLFEGNEAGNDSQASDGGAIYAFGELNLDSSQSDTNIFKGNKAYDDGGAIYLNDADGDSLDRNVIINNAHFIDNVAVDKGGAIYVNRDETITISNTKFKGNKATNGAAINIGQGTVSIGENVSFDNNEGAEDIYFSGTSGNLDFNDFGEITLENGISAASSSKDFKVTLGSTSSESKLKIGEDGTSNLKNVAIELGDKTTLSIETNTDTSLSDLILNSGSTLDLTYDVRDSLDTSSKINTIATDELTIETNASIQVDSLFDKTQGLMDSISVTTSLNASETITIDADIVLKEDFNDDTFSMNSNSFITEPNGYSYKIDIVDRFVAPESLAKNYVYKATESLAGHEIKLEKFATITGLPNAIANGSVSEYILSSAEDIYLWGLKEDITEYHLL